jgi:hypothetical protein
LGGIVLIGIGLKILIQHTLLSWFCTIKPFLSSLGLFTL